MFWLDAKQVCAIHSNVVFQVGLMYCREGQQSEEEMYNNEDGGAGFNEFLELIGQKVRLKGFNKYKAGLCSKSKLRQTI